MNIEWSGDFEPGAWRAEGDIVTLSRNGIPMLEKIGVYIYLYIFTYTHTYSAWNL